MDFERRSGGASAASVADLTGPSGRLARDPVHWTLRGGEIVGVGDNLDGTCGGSITTD